MQIIIDTEKESKEDLKKLANFLRNLAGEENYYSEKQTSQKQEFEPVASEGMFNMFGNDTNSSDKQTNNYDNNEPFYETRDEKEDKDEPKIQIVDW